MLREIRTYTELHSTLRERADHLDMSRETIDHLAGFPAGYSGKILGRRQVRRLSAISLLTMSQSFGLTLVLAEAPDLMMRIQPLVGTRDTRHVVRRDYHPQIGA